MRKEHFFEQYDKTENIFDLMALCIRYIRMVSQEPLSIDMGHENFKGINDIFLSYVREQETYFDEFSVFRNFKLKLREEITLLSAKMCYAVILSIDKYIEPQFYDDIENDEPIEKYSFLNYNYTDKVGILPIIKNNGVSHFNKRFKKGKYEPLRRKYPKGPDFISEKLNNYIVLEEDILNKNEVTIYRVKQEFKRKKCSFLLNPITCDCLDKYFVVNYSGEGETKFSIEKEKEKIEELEERYRNIMDGFKNMEAPDFIIFPEMLMTEKILENITREDGISSFIFNGTIWSQKRNMCTLTYKGKEIFRYRKKHSYNLKKNNVEYCEDIKQEDNKKKFMFLDIEGLGRISVGICKDIMFDDIMNIHKTMAVNILLVPAYTNSFDMTSKIKEFSESYQGITIISNSCGAFHEGDSSDKQEEVGLIMLPAMENSRRTYYQKIISPSDCPTDCKCKSRCGYLINIDFENMKETENRTTIYHDIKDKSVC